jgi:hypothetical protein
VPNVIKNIFLWLISSLAVLGDGMREVTDSDMITYMFLLFKRYTYNAVDLASALDGRELTRRILPHVQRTAYEARRSWSIWEIPLSRA